MQRLINSWKEEDLKNPNKLICNLCLKNSKILKLDENNQYGFAMTKPLLIGIFKEKIYVTLEILNDVVRNYNPNDKVGHIFIVDIDFCENDDPRKKMYNEVFPCM